MVLVYTDDALVFRLFLRQLEDRGEEVVWNRREKEAERMILDMDAPGAPRLLHRYRRRPVLLLSRSAGRLPPGRPSALKGSLSPREALEKLFQEV